MKFFQRIFNFYIDSSIHVAFGVLSLVEITGLALNISINHHLSYFLFFSTIASYNFIKYGVEAEKYILVANQYHKNIQILSFIAVGFAFYHFYFLPKNIWIGLFILMCLSGLYALPILPNAKNLRSLGGLKIFIVALVWAGATVILPSLAQDSSAINDVGILTFQRFLFVLIVLIPFEIRDLKYDSKDLRTLPQRFGVANTKTFGSILVLCFFFMTFLKGYISRIELIVNGVLFLVLGFLMFFTKRQQGNYFASFWVEIIPVFWLLLWYGLELKF